MSASGSTAAAAVRALAGARAGLLATVPMSAVMVAGGLAGILHQPPPVVVVDALTPPLPAPVRRAGTVAAHAAFGAGAGAVLGVVLPPALRRPAVGVLAGLTVWAVSYEGWVPALGILPPAHRDVRSRAVTVLLAHLVWGRALADH